MKLHHLFAIGSLVLTGMVGCVASDDPGLESVDDTTSSFAEFEARTYREPETGIYIVDGDIPILTRAELQSFWEENLQPGALIINKIGSNDDRWSPAAQQSISYCVSTTFGSNYSRVVQAMAEASMAWQDAGRSIRFVYRSDQDSACDATNTNVVFDVRPTIGLNALARAFFPSSGRPSRNILIDSSTFGTITPWTLTGVLRHELGHTLGFRHEQTRPEAGTCFEDTNWRALTSYDAASVMHYPQCNGSNQGDLVLSALDRAGAAAVYGSCGLLVAGQSLSVGQGLSSCDGRFSLVMQSDGNLALYQQGVGALWSSSTWGTNGLSAVMQGDGNFVLYSTTPGQALWNSGTWSNPGAYLVVQNDGNIVIYTSNARTPLWTSGTGGH